MLKKLCSTMDFLTITVADLLILSLIWQVKKDHKLNFSPQNFSEENSYQINQKYWFISSLFFSPPKLIRILNWVLIWPLNLHFKNHCFILKQIPKSQPTVFVIKKMTLLSDSFGKLGGPTLLAHCVYVLQGAIVGTKAFNRIFDYSNNSAKIICIHE